MSSKEAGLAGRQCHSLLARVDRDQATTQPDRRRSFLGRNGRTCGSADRCGGGQHSAVSGVRQASSIFPPNRLSTPRGDDALRARKTTTDDGGLCLRGNATTLLTRRITRHVACRSHVRSSVGGQSGCAGSGGHVARRANLRVMAADQSALYGLAGRQSGLTARLLPSIASLRLRGTVNSRLHSRARGVKHTLSE